MTEDLAFFALGYLNILCSYAAARENQRGISLIFAIGAAIWMVLGLILGIGEISL